MPQCTNCKKEILTDWSYCPYCGTDISGEDIKEDRLEKIRYLWERQEGGKILYQKFSAVRTMGITPYKKVKPFRPILGDWSHLLLTELRVVSLMHSNPNTANEMYTKVKLIGYYAIRDAIHTLKLNQSVKLLDKPGLFWRVFHDKAIWSMQKEGWYNLKEAIIELNKIDEKGKTIEYTLKESTNSILKSNRPICFMEVALLCGTTEALSSGFWDGKETKCECMGDDKCIIQIHYHETEEEPEIDISKDEIISALDQLTTITVERRKGLRRKLGDYTDMPGDQCLNYLFLTPSQGHRVLSKHSGKICGEIIGEKSKVQGLENSLKYIADLFLYLKAGIIEEHEIIGDRIFFDMSESVYASGAENINTKLCVFLAGIMEGVLNKATNEKWFVDEVECIGTGHSKCRFVCIPNKRSQ